MKTSSQNHVQNHPKTTLENLPWFPLLAFRSLEDPWIILQLVRPIAGTAFITSSNAAATPQPYKMESYPSRRPHQIHVLYFSPSISPTFQCLWDSYHTPTFFQILQGEFTNHIFVSVFNGYPAPCNLNCWVDYMARLLLFSYQEPGWHFFPRARGLWQGTLTSPLGQLFHPFIFFSTEALHSRSRLSIVGL